MDEYLMSSNIILFLRKNCEITDSIKSFMTDSMWQLVQVQYTVNTPYLLIGSQRVTNPQQIQAYLQKIQSSTHSTLSNVEQLNNARNAAIRAIKELIQTGTSFAPPELINHRRSICGSCPFKARKLFIERCSKCGCHIKSKTALITETCPLDKW